METRFSRDRIRSAVVAVADMFPTVMQGASWVSQSEGYLWSELVACILGSQVSHEMCSAAHERLDRHGLLDVGPASDLDDLGQDLACVLSLPFERADNSFHFSGRYRFARSKSRQIAVTASRLYGNSRGLRAILGGTTNPRIARRKLIGLCCGIGPKQSSLFLRNIGFTSELAVLDVHIIRYMAWMGIGTQAGAALNSLRKYEEQERCFRRHADTYGVSPGILDEAVWVVMRTISTGV